jgi:hypothetical protein
MTDGWNADSSYDYLKKFLENAGTSFDIRMLSESPRIVSDLETGTLKKPVLLLRHDVDVSMKRALKIASVELGLGIKSTYMVQTASPLYSLEDDESQRCVEKIIEMGHDIGLHLRASGSGGGVPDEGEIFKDRRILEDLTGKDVRSVSFHRPSAGTPMMGGAQKVCGMVNCYGKDLMGWYLSDSRGIWRAGEPIGQLSKKGGKLLQVLIHPIWWGDRHATPEERLEEYFQEAKGGRDEEFKRTLDKRIFEEVDVRRSGLGPII